MPSVVYLDNNNEAKFNYNGAGLGDVTINVSDTTDISQDITITDYLQYWKSGSNSSYEKYKAISGNILALSNGWKIENSSSTNTYPIAIIGLGEGDIDFDEDWIVEFKVINAYLSHFDATCWHDNPATISDLNMQDIALKKDDTISIKREMEVLTVKQNGTTKFTKEATDGYPAIAIDRITTEQSTISLNGVATTNTITVSKPAYLTIDDLKFKVI